MLGLFLKFGKRLVAWLQSAWVDIQDILPSASRDFSWKVRRRINFDRNPLFVTLQDKYRVKEYAQERGVQAATTFYVTDEPDTIPFSSLPEEYFIKANHGCGWNILHTNNEFYLYASGRDFRKSGDLSKIKLTQNECVDICRKWMKSVYSKREWAYKEIIPQIVVEEVLLAPLNEDELKEYKFYVFGGQVKAVNIRSSTYRQNHQNIFFDAMWNEFVLTIYKEKTPEIKPVKPENFDEMISIAQTLGKNIDFVRVDLFNTKRGIVLGEMTIYPYGGNVNTPTGDPEFNRWLGDQWVLAV